jgi:hypothetical protein
VGEGAGSAVEDVGSGAGHAVGEVGEGAGSAVADVGRRRGRTGRRSSCGRGWTRCWASRRECGPGRGRRRLGSWFRS